MLNESILLGTMVAMTSIFLTGCSSKKKAAPSVAKSPAVNNPKSPVNVANSSVSKSPAKDKDDDEKKEGDGEKKEAKEEEKKENEDEKKDDKDDIKKSNEKDDEKKEEDGEKKKDSDEKDEKKDDDKKEEDKENKAKKKETFICAEPTELRFETAITSQKKLRLKNLSSKKLMFKIKSTTTNIYLINPVFGKIEPNNFVDVMITHRPSAKREDKLVIITTEMLGKEIEMAKTFKQIKTTGADVAVKLVAF